MDNNLILILLYLASLFFWYFFVQLIRKGIDRREARMSIRKQKKLEVK